MSLLHSLPAIVQKRAKRIGRGYGSGKGGHTSSRGTKGQKSRRGATIPLWFEGGQLPIIKRMPMLRGKGRLKSVSPSATVTLSELQAMQSDIITMETLLLEKVISERAKKAKVVATGSLKRAVQVQGVQVSAGARGKIEAAGGSVQA